VENSGGPLDPSSTPTLVSVKGISYDKPARFANWRKPLPPDLLAKGVFRETGGVRQIDVDRPP